ncbi:hypothetical protein Tco_0985875, partial [Tanacetum coccineum]
LQKLWVEVEVSNKWIGNNLKNHAPEVNTAGLILQWFNNTAKKMVTEVQSMDIGSTNDNSIYSVIEKRESSVNATVQLLGETTQIINNLQDRELPDLDPAELMDCYCFIKLFEEEQARFNAKQEAIVEEPETPKKVKKRVQVQINRDEELSRKLFEEEQARFNAEQEAKALTEQEQERLNLEAAWELQRQLDERQEEVRKNLIMYLKNQGGYKMNYFKGMTYEEIRPIFEKKLDDDDAEKAELRECLNIIEDEVKVIEPLSAKAHRNYLMGNTFSWDLQQDLEDMYKLVKETYKMKKPQAEALVLWGDLKTIFEPDESDEIWKNQ